MTATETTIETPAPGRTLTALEVAPRILTGYAEELEAAGVRLRTECDTDEATGKPLPPCEECVDEAEQVETRALVLREVAQQLPDLAAAQGERDLYASALREILDGAPEKDPGEGTWASLEEAYQAGVDASHFDLAEIARRALGLPTAADETEEDEEAGPCFVCGDEGIVTAQVKIGPADSDEVLAKSHKAPLCAAHFADAMRGDLDIVGLLAARGAITPVEAADAR